MKLPRPKSILNAIRKLKSSYQGYVTDYSIAQCPLCKCCKSKIGNLRYIDCNLCPWVLLEGYQCHTQQKNAWGIRVFYSKDAFKMAMKRLDRWEEIYSDYTKEKNL